MTEMSRRTFVSAVAGAAATAGVVSQVDSQDIPTPAVVSGDPEQSLSPALDSAGEIRIGAGSRAADFSPVGVVVTYPEVDPVGIVEPTVDAGGGVLRFDLKDVSVPRGTPLACIICSDSTGASFDSSDYTGELAPFMRTASGFVPHQSESNLETKTVDSIRSGGPSGIDATVHRLSKEGSYRLRFEAEEWDKYNYGTGSLGAPEIELGKTAYANARQGIVRDPSRIYEQAEGSTVIDALAAAIGDEIDTTRATPTQAQRFVSTVAFVQNLPYAYDKNSVGFPDYAKLPEETLVEGESDCEDKALLLAALLAHESLGMDPALIFPPGHASLSIPRDEFPLPESEFYDAGLFEFGDQEHLYIEAVRPLRYGNNIFYDPVSYDSLVGIYDDGWRRARPDEYLRSYDELP